MVGMFNSAITFYVVRGQHGGAVVYFSTVTSQDEAPGFDSRGGNPNLVPFPVFVWVLSRFSTFLTQSKDLQSG